MTGISFGAKNNSLTNSMRRDCSPISESIISEIIFNYVGKTTLYATSKNIRKIWKEKQNKLRHRLIIFTHKPSFYLQNMLFSQINLKRI